MELYDLISVYAILFSVLWLIIYIPLLIYAIVKNKNKRIIIMTVISLVAVGVLYYMKDYILTLIH